MYTTFAHQINHKPGWKWKKALVCSFATSSPLPETPKTFLVATV